MKDYKFGSSFPAPKYANEDNNRPSEFGGSTTTYNRLALLTSVLSSARAPAKSLTYEEALQQSMTSLLHLLIQTVLSMGLHLIPILKDPLTANARLNRELIVKKKLKPISYFESSFQGSLQGL